MVLFVLLFIVSVVHGCLVIVNEVRGTHIYDIPGTQYVNRFYVGVSRFRRGSFFFFFFHWPRFGMVFVLQDVRCRERSVQARRDANDRRTVLFFVAPPLWRDPPFSSSFFFVRIKKKYIYLNCPL